VVSVWEDEGQSPFELLVHVLVSEQQSPPVLHKYVEAEEEVRPAESEVQQLRRAYQGVVLVHVVVAHVRGLDDEGTGMEQEA